MVAGVSYQMFLEERLKSLDAFRGLTVAAMILVNNPGSWSSVYPPLLHAPWHGCTPTDLIFPFFLFSVGVSIQFAYQSKRAGGLTKEVWLKILKRSLIIFCLGLFLSLFPKFNFETVRIPGVLQRISLVFLCCSIFYFLSTRRTQLILFTSLLIVYYLILTFIPVPGVGPANLEMNTNLAAWLDRTVLSGHLWAQTKTWDPEGILTTLPAVATGVSGMLVGSVLTSPSSTTQRLKTFVGAGILSVVVGLVWNAFFPFNKSLWTSSYVLFTSGLATLLLTGFYWLIDIKKMQGWSQPLLWYGVNSLAVFVASGLLAKILIRTKVTTPEGFEQSVWTHLYESLFVPWLRPHNASLAFAFLWVMLFGIILFVLFRRKIIIKV